MLSTEDRILTESLRVEKGYGAKKIVAELPRKDWSFASVNRLLRSKTFRSSKGPHTVIKVTSW